MSNKFVIGPTLALLTIALLCGCASTTGEKPIKDRNTNQPPTPAAARESGQPLKLINPSFEEGDIAASGWTRGGKIEGVEYIWDKEVACTGKASLGIRKTEKKYFPIAEWAQRVPHTGKTSKLRLSAFVKAEEVHKAVLDVAYKTADGKQLHQWAVYIGAKNPSDPPATHDWKQYSGVVAIPKDAKELVIGLQVYGPGAIWFDDVSAEYVSDDTPVSLYDEEGKPKPP